MKDEPTRVLEALETSEYDWTTLQSVVQDTGLSEKDVNLVLESLVWGGKVVKKADENGFPLYTTKSHYNRASNLLNRTLSAIAGRVR